LPVNPRLFAAAAGAGVLAAAFLGAIPFGYLVTRRRLRKDIRRLDDNPGTLELQVRALLAGPADDPDAPPASRRSDVVVAVLDTAKVLVGATLAWHLLQTIAPGHGHFARNESGVAFAANQVLSFWQSCGLWAGVAAVATHLAPVGWHRSSSQGQAPALGLVFVYCPIGFSAGVFAFFTSLFFLRDVTRSALVAFPCFIAYVFLAWTFDWPSSWGVPNGPEVTLWAAVVGGILITRTLAISRSQPAQPQGGAQ
jgi:glycerol-3-phosphate acyltransferase PlsY